MLHAAGDLLWELLPGPARLAVRVGRILAGPVLFVGGFTWDALTLSRIDAWMDNLFLGTYLLLLGAALVLDERARVGRLPEALVQRRWVFRLAVHFFFGGLLSAYVVYYLQSAALGRTLLFLGLLASLLVINEFLQPWIRGPGVRLALYLLCSFSFLLFWIPVASGLIGKGAWMLAAIGAFVLTALVRLLMAVSPSSLPGMVRRLVHDVRLAQRRWRGETASAEPDAPVQAEAADESAPASDAEIALDRIRRDPVARLRWQLIPALSWGGAGLSWAGLLLLLLLLELGGMIPPVPISVLHMGVYHDVDHRQGQVVLSREQAPWWRPWQSDDSRYLLRGEDRVCVFAPVYAPRGIHPRLYHRWERWDADAGTWEWTGDPGTWIQARGGRQDGSPHYTCKRRSLRPGPWRVSVETEDGRLVAQHGFSMLDGEHGELVLVEQGWP